jgi:hypothetical protein
MTDVMFWLALSSGFTGFALGVVVSLFIKVRRLK